MSDLQLGDEKGDSNGLLKHVMTPPPKKSNQPFSLILLLIRHCKDQVFNFYSFHHRQWPAAAGIRWKWQQESHFCGGPRVPCLPHNWCDIVEPCGTWYGAENAGDFNLWFWTCYTVSYQKTGWTWFDLNLHSTVVVTNLSQRGSAGVYWWCNPIPIWCQAKRQSFCLRGQCSRWEPTQHEGHYVGWIGKIEPTQAR